MSHYLDYGFQFTKEKPICAAWSNSEFQPLLALATTLPRVIFLQEEVIVQEYEINKGKKCTALKWNPLYLSLGLGWEDGSVSLWSEDDRILREEKLVHKTEVTCIVFSSDGNRMVTGDKVFLDRIQDFNSLESLECGRLIVDFLLFVNISVKVPLLISYSVDSLMKKNPWKSGIPCSSSQPTLAHSVLEMT